MPDHPPLPPTSEFVKRSARQPDNDAVATVTLPQIVEGQPHYARGSVRDLIGFNPELRPIITALFRCEWFDLATPSTACMKEYQIAVNNAEAWRKWGRGEAWE